MEQHNNRPPRVANAPQQMGANTQSQKEFESEQANNPLSNPMAFHLQKQLYMDKVFHQQRGHERPPMTVMLDFQNAQGMKQQNEAKIDHQLNKRFPDYQSSIVRQLEGNSRFFRPQTVTAMLNAAPMTTQVFTDSSNERRTGDSVNQSQLSILNPIRKDIVDSDFLTPGSIDDYAKYAAAKFSYQDRQQIAKVRQSMFMYK